MSTGDIFNPKRSRMQANERLDTVDVDGLSIQAREHLDAWSRAIEAVPRKLGSTIPTGLIFQGFNLQLNPTGASDNKVRVLAALPGVAFDADGRMLIKQSGSSTDLTLPSGNSQIYAYYVENGVENVVRRRISVTAPYTESGTAQNTRFLGTVAFHVRAGDQTSIVASDVVNGATTALCFLGVANNAAGVITMTGFNSTTAPNGAFAVNRITSVTQPTTLPTLNTHNGSIATIHDLINAALYMVGQAVWKGSKNFTPAVGNNFGAFTPPTVGIDALFDSQAEGTLTPTTRWRDWQQNIRFLVDHQGYPGGQISVVDDHWYVYPGVVNVDPSVGFATGGAPTVVVTSPFGVNFPASSAAWLVPLDRDSVPVGPTSSFTHGAVITGVTVHYSSTNASNTLTGALSYGSIGGAQTTQVSRTVTTPVTTHSSFDVMVTPTAGQGPKVVSSSERLQVQLSCTIAGGSVTVQLIQINYALPPLGWALFLTKNDAVGSADNVVFSDPVSTLNQRNLQFTAKSLGVIGGSSMSSVPEVYVDNDLAHSMDFIVRTGTVIDGSNTATVNIGMRGTLTVRWGVVRASAGANWLLQLDPDGLTPTNADSGVAFANNTTYRMKIEFQGANRNSSGFARARLWINGALVATVTLAGAITAGPAKSEISVSATGTSGPYDLRVGRLHRAWNLLAAGDNV